jgi:hypothetical protein
MAAARTVVRRRPRLVRRSARRAIHAGASDHALGNVFVVLRPVDRVHRFPVFRHTALVWQRSTPSATPTRACDVQKH